MSPQLGLILALALLPRWQALSNVSKCQCYRPSEKRDEYVRSPRMHELLSLAALPRELDWRNKDGVNYVTMSRNQHIPFYCGACWAFSTTSALSDRIRIARGPAGAEVNLAVQVVLNCDMVNQGCNGGDGVTAYQFIKSSGGIPSETCQPYLAEGHDTGKTCTAMDVCRTCDSKGCFAQYEHPVWSIAEYGTVRGEHQMMAELQRGPIACAIATPVDFCNFRGDGIYEDKENKSQIDHLIGIVGYGEENGEKYWIVRNSWGTYYGYYGFVKVARGKNNIFIETDCAWATPSNGGQPTMRRTQLDVKEMPHQNSAVKFAADHSRGERKVSDEPISSVASADAPACRVPKLDWYKMGGEKVRSPRPEVSAELPKSWDWRNVSGVSYVTSNVNEHNPQYCASCWAFGPLSALSDRLAVQTKGVWPKVALSPQVLLNCGGGGSCEGGDPAGVYAYISENGIVDMTCQNYQGRKLECNAQGICETCAENNNEHGLAWPGHCGAVRNPVMYFVSEYGSVRGATSMQAEIYKRGPIACGLHASAGFRRYNGGIYSEDGDETLNHEVSLAGWGSLGSVEYWSGRNSWGTTWGEDGWFRIRMHKSNLGVESDCSWGVPVQGPPVPSTEAVNLKSATRPRLDVLFLGLASLAAAFFALRVFRSSAESESAEHYVQVA